MPGKIKVIFENHMKILLYSVFQIQSLLFEVVSMQITVLEK